MKNTHVTYVNVVIALRTYKRIPCLNSKFTAVAQLLTTLVALLSFAAEGNAKNSNNIKTSLDHHWAISLYSGLHASNTLDDIVSHDATYSDGNKVLVAALAREIYHYKQYLSFEIEGQIGTLLGVDATNWEGVGLGIVRWEVFPWDNIVNTSMAVGAGFSYYSSISQIERNRNEEAQRLLGYLAFEITFGIPRYSRWDLMMRIHHRSGMGGLIGQGSSNYVCTGLKYNF